MGERSRLITEENLDFACVDDSQDDAIAELLVPDEVPLLEVRANIVGFEVSESASENGFLPLLLEPRGGSRPGGMRRRSRSG